MELKRKRGEERLYKIIDKLCDNTFCFTYDYDNMPSYILIKYNLGKLEQEQILHAYLGCIQEGSVEKIKIKINNIKKYTITYKVSKNHGFDKNFNIYENIYEVKWGEWTDLNEVELIIRRKNIETSLNSLEIIVYIKENPDIAAYISVM